MGCAASKLDIETADRSILSGLRPINIKKHRRRRLRRLNTFSTTSDIIQSDRSETAGDTSPSGKVKVSIIAPEPIAEEESEISDQEELTMTDDSEMRKVPEEKDPKENIKRGAPKEVSEEKKQKWQEMTKNGEQPEQVIEERSHRPITEKIKENKEEADEDVQVKSSRETEELAKDREEPTKEEKEDATKSKEDNNHTEESRQKAKEEDTSRQMITREAKESNEEVERKNKEPMEKNKAGYGPKLISKRIEELEEVFPGSPSFRFYCQNVPSFDSDDSITAPVLRSTERLEEIKQQNEPIEEVSESQASASTSISASSQGSQCHSPRKRRGRRMLKLKAPNSVRTLFTCYSASNGCGNSSPGSIRYKKHLISKPK